MIYPLAPKAGSTIGLIAPAGYIDEEKLKASIGNIASLGFKPYFLPSILDTYGQFAGSDQRRLDELMHMFTNPEVRAIFCVRGGSGTNRILNKIDYSAIAQDPKVFVGYSDITALHHAILKKSDLITFHGPMASSRWTKYSKMQLNRAVFDLDSRFDILLYDEKSKEKHDRYSIFNGSASAPIVGGNLSIVSSLIGTDFEINFDNKIVFLEDVSEEPYRIDRMLGQFILAHKFDKVKGIAFGIFKDCEPEHLEHSLSLKETLFDRLKDLKIPMAYGFQFGHITDNCTIPQGANAFLDTSKMLLRIERDSNEFYA